MKTYLHVNQHNIKFNANNKGDLIKILLDLEINKTRAMGLYSSALISNNNFNKITGIILKNI